MDRHLVCFGISAFEVAVVRLRDPCLSTRPVAIAPLNTSQACLREVSSEAEQAGLGIGMPVEQARQVCPSLHVLSTNPSCIRTTEESLLPIVSRDAPVWEPVQLGSFVKDLTETGRRPWASDVLGHLDVFMPHHLLHRSMGGLFGQHLLVCGQPQ